MNASMSDFLGTECQLLKPVTLFIALYQATKGDPCTKGCAYFEGGKCPAYQALKGASRQTTAEQQETVREYAARLGVSLSEARKMRRGTT